MLAATVKGRAAEGLIDSYEIERHPVAAAVLEWTRVQVTTLIPDLFGEVTANLVKDLINTVDGSNYFISRIWGIANRYDLGSEHPLVGRSAPDFEFVDGLRLGRKMENGRGLIIEFGKTKDLSSLAEEWIDQLDYITLSAKDMLGLRALIVRPDGVRCCLTNVW
ncbi:MAG: hypothetical protein EOP04_08880 [Proteobacteria bacterium]|nr:MAG: hypothetical protein EOP04_08880 [Pseudomonadota bacterium]